MVAISPRVKAPSTSHTSRVSSAPNSPVWRRAADDEVADDEVGHRDGHDEEGDAGQPVVEPEEQRPGSGARPGWLPAAG